MNVLLIQLPIPQLQFGVQTGNIPLAGACLAQAAANAGKHQVRIFPESLAAYLADAAILDQVHALAPDVVGFTVYCWNVERCLHLARMIKQDRQVKVVFGGPEVTPDNPLMASDTVDFRVYGEGEAVFLRLLETPELWHEGQAAMSAGTLFQNARSPYIDGLLEPQLEHMMLLETQRGCPYRCGYCYYNKSRKFVARVSQSRILQAIQWAIDEKLSEVFLLDPSLDTRPDLDSLVDAMARVNGHHQVAFQSEIRADRITPSLAKQFARAGFSEFEVGLQSTNPKALRLMNRPTHLERFTRGVHYLLDNGIRARVDLIIGLPGDTLDTFKQSVDYVVQQDIGQDIQVFFLSVLPGTDFRRHYKSLGLVYDPRPPYTIRQTPEFTQHRMMEAFYYAEEALDVSLQPEPGLDLAYRDGEKYLPTAVPVPDFHQSPSNQPYLCKILVSREIPDDQLQNMARRLTHPYQVIFMKTMADWQFITRALAILTAANPHTPLEIVFMDPLSVPDTHALDAALKLHRPLYLDLDLPGHASRSVLYTLVTPTPVAQFGGVMKRQVFLWKSPRLPTQSDLTNLEFFSGILMDNDISQNRWIQWQDRFARQHEDWILISFSDRNLQSRWDALTRMECSG